MPRPGSTSARHQLRPRPSDGGTSDPERAEAVLYGWPVLLVVHDATGVWHLLPGHPDGGSSGDGRGTGRRVALPEMVRSDPQLGELLGLGKGWVAGRSAPNRAWQRRPG